jgi:hypothetical protein
MARKRVPIAKYTHSRFDVIIKWGIHLDLSEVLFTCGLCGMGTLFLMASKLTFPQTIFCLVCLWSWPLMLFAVVREGYNVSEWLSGLLPYWTRQKTFYRRVNRKIIDPEISLLDKSVISGPNLIYWEWRTGDDGIRELHVFELPQLAHRALIAKKREAVLQARFETAAGRPVSANPRPRVIKLP